jgi:hypothetical protein
VKEALKQVEKDQTNIFNIMGIPYDRNGRNGYLFLYSPDGSVQIFVNGQLENTVKVK